MAVTYDNASSSSGSGTSLSYSHTNTGSNIVLVVFGLVPETTTISGITYNGVAMTYYGDTGSGTGARSRIYVYYMLDAPAGTYTVSVTAGSSTTIYSGAQSYTNASNVSDGAGCRTNGGGCSAAVYATSNTDSKVVVCISSSGEIPTFTGATERWAQDSSKTKGWDITGASSLNINTDSSHSGWWVETGISVDSAFYVSVVDTITVSEYKNVDAGFRLLSVSDTVTVSDVKNVALRYDIKANEFIYVVDNQLKQANNNATGYDVYGATGSREELGQQFYATGTKIKSVELKMRKVGAPTDDIVVKITSSLGGAALASKQLTTSQMVSGSFNVFEFSGMATVVSGTAYYIEVSRTGSRSSTNCWGLYTYVPNPDIAAYNIYRGNRYEKDTGVWALQSTTRDFAFMVSYADLPNISVSVSIDVFEDITVLEQRVVPPPSTHMIEELVESISVTDVVDDIDRPELAQPPDESVRVLESVHVKKMLNWGDRSGKPDSWFDER